MGYSISDAIHFGIESGPDQTFESLRSLDWVLFDLGNLFFHLKTQVASSLEGPVDGSDVNAGEGAFLK